MIPVQHGVTVQFDSRSISAHCARHNPHRTRTLSLSLSFALL